MKYFAIKLVHADDAAPAREEIASVKANDMAEAIAIAMRRYPGTMAVDGEFHATVPAPDDTEAADD